MTEMTPTEEITEEVDETGVEAPEEVQEEEVQEEEEAQEEKTEDKASEYSRNVQKRIDKITGEKYELKSELEQLRSKLTKYEEVAGERPTPPIAGQFVDEYGELDQAKFNEALIRYEDSVFDWRTNKQEKDTAEKKAEAAEAARIERWNIASESVKGKYADWDEIMTTTQFPKPLVEVLTEEPEMAYYLAKNENERLRLGNMAPIQMIRELGKLEGRIASLSKKSSKAPAPISPLSGDSEMDPGEDDSKLSDEAWFAKEEKKRLKKLEKEIRGR